MLVEPFAGDTVASNLNPVGRMYYGASSQICVPVSLARNGPALGAQAGQARLGAIMREAGFTRFRRATEPPFNLVLEARPCHCAPDRSAGPGTPLRPTPGACRRERLKCAPPPPGASRPALSSLRAQRPHTPTSPLFH